MSEILDKNILKSNLQQIYDECGSQAEIKRRYGASQPFLEKQIKLQNVKLRTMSEIIRKRKLNHNYFSTIDTPNKAWVLGFFHTDGNVYKNEICIDIHPDDVEVLRFIVAEWEYDGEIRYHTDNEGHNHATLKVRSTQMMEDLLRLGVTPNKSCKARLCSIPKHLYGHYIRGILDGNGCVCYHNRKGKVSARAFYIVSGCRLFLEDIKEKMPTECIIYKKKENAYHLVCANGNGICKLYEYFYKYEYDFLKLARKYEIFTEFYDYFTQSKANKSSRFKGVIRTYNNKWRANIVKDKIGYYLGTFETELQAANAYNDKAIELYGDKAKLNEI